MHKLELDLAHAPTRRRAYFMESLIEPPPASISETIAPRSRSLATFARAVVLYAVTLALAIAAVLMALSSERASSTAIAFVALLGAGALLVAMSLVLAEDIGHRLSDLPLLFAQLRNQWRRLRRALRALAGGSTALS